MELNRPYFYTATIYRWKQLLAREEFKEIITDSLDYLVCKKKLKVYAFVIMPNHIHLIWELLSFNGKEKPNASFMKFTAHCFRKKLLQTNPSNLDLYIVNTNSRQYNFWQRDPDAFWLYDPKTIQQKLDYLHGNPCQGKWMLADSPFQYKYSSLKYYETGIDDFGFLSHISDLF